MLVACLAIAFALLPAAAQAGQAAEPLQVTFVYSQQCLSCEHARPAVEKAFAEAPAPVKVSRLDINSREGAEYARAHGIVSIPAVVVNCGPPLLFEDYSSVESYDSALRERMACEAGTGRCNDATSPSCTTEKKMTELSIPAAFLAGLIAGINPCLLAVMAFIASTTLAATGSGTSIIARVVSFCGGLLAI